MGIPDHCLRCRQAGPTGYGLHRQISQLGQDCIVVAPSLIPRKAGKRVKTNRLDALSLVKQLRAGKPTAVWVPDERHEEFPCAAVERQPAAICRLNRSVPLRCAPKAWLASE